MIKKILTIALISFMLSSCLDDFSIIKPTDLQSGAYAVRMIKTLPANVKCNYLGEVVGSQGNFFTGGLTSNQSLEQGARNELKNKAVALGGNAVVLITDRSGRGSQYETTNVTYTGNAYHCKFN